MSYRRIVLSIVLTIGVATACAQEEQSEVRIARLISRLGSRNFTEREAATSELEALGAVSKKHLENALQSPDAETRLRAVRLLEKIRVAELWQPKLVTIKLDNEPTAKALAQLSEQSGNRLFTGDHFGPFRDPALTVALENVPFFQALDEICRRSGNQMRPNYDQRNPGLVLAQGDIGRCPLAYAGPVRAKLTTARRVFIEELDYDASGRETTHTFQFNLSLMWEDRFRLVAYQSQVEAVEAVTDTGVVLAPGAAMPSDWKTVSPGNRQVTMSLRLQPPPTAAKSLQKLRLRWGLLAVGDMASLAVEDLKQSAPHAQDDVQLTIVNFQELADERYELTLLVNRDLVVPEPQEVLYQENTFELFDVQGRALKKQVNHWRWTDAGLRISATFAPEFVDRNTSQNQRQPARLVFTYPRLRAQHRLEIVFHDVPLPSAKPD